VHTPQFGVYFALDPIKCFGELMAELDDHIYDEITSLTNSGNALAEAAQFEEAEKLFLKALRLLPEPHIAWEAATWLYVAIGDVNFHLKNYEKVFRCFTNAVQCPGGLGNPFVHLRLGQAQLELGRTDRAGDELTRAYMGGGLDIFMEDDPKYLEFLETKIEI